MAEDRMLSDEILLGLIKKNGGGGGTTNYNLLENKPQIAGTELQGDKSLADLGIASASDLAAKQNALTAGDYIDITNDEISVDREIPSVIAEYEIKTEPMVEGQAFISVTKTVNGEVVLTQKYGSNTAGISQGINFDENIYVDYSKTAAWSWTYKLRNASVDHAANYTQSWNYGSTVDYTEEFVVTDHSGDKLVIKSEMDTALADKADTDIVAADFNAGTSYTAGNYCVQDGKLYKFKNNHSGAWSAADVDEVKIAGELSSLKNGLTSKSESITTGLFSSLLVKRCTDVVSISGEYVTTGEALSANTWATIATVSSDYRPSNDRYLSAYICGANGALLASARLTVKANGEVSLCPSSNIASGTAVFFAVTFVI